MKKLLKLVFIVGGIAAVSKLVTAKKAEWHDLTESQVREKLDSRLPGRIPDEKRTAVADQIVSKMRDRGVLREKDEAASPAPDEEGDAAVESPDATTGRDSGNTDSGDGRDSGNTDSGDGDSEDSDSGDSDSESV